MSKSQSANIISPEDFYLWQGLIDLRNSLVHNNGVAENTKNYVYPDCELELKARQMIKVDLRLRLFLSLTDWLLDSSKEWIVQMDKK